MSFRLKSHGFGDETTVVITTPQKTACKERCLQKFYDNVPMLCPTLRTTSIVLPELPS